MGTLLISKIREEYPDRIMNTFSVVPSPKVIFFFHCFQIRSGCVVGDVNLWHMSCNQTIQSDLL